MHPATGIKEMRVVLKCENVVCWVPKFCASDTAKGNKSEDSLGRTLKQPWENCGEKTLYSVFIIHFLVVVLFCYYVLFLCLSQIFFFFPYGLHETSQICPFLERQIQPCLVNGTDE